VRAGRQCGVTGVGSRPGGFWSLGSAAQSRDRDYRKIVRRTHQPKRTTSVPCPAAHGMAACCRSPGAQSDDNLCQ
jgi:hypothetical protein